MDAPGPTILLAELQADCAVVTDAANKAVCEYENQHQVISKRAPMN